MITDLAAACDAALALASNRDIALTRCEPSVSSWSIAQHLEHAAHALRGCLATVAHIGAGKGQLEDGETSAEARMILDAGRIPRGRADAPKRTLPAPHPDRGAIEHLLRDAAKRIEKLALWDPDREPASGCIIHQDLGPMEVSQWLKFAAIHTRHHLDIVDEILAHSAT